MNRKIGLPVTGVALLLAAAPAAAQEAVPGVPLESQYVFNTLSFLVLRPIRRSFITAAKLVVIFVAA